jgi:hypothetical protein
MQQYQLSAICILATIILINASGSDDEHFYRKADLFRLKQRKSGSLKALRGREGSQGRIQDQSTKETKPRNLIRKKIIALKSSTKNAYKDDESSKRRSAEQREALRSCVRWGVGLEHESMLVHRKEGGLEEYVVDAGRVLREMSVYGPVHGLSRELHEYAIRTYQDGAGMYSDQNRLERIYAIHGSVRSQYMFVFLRFLHLLRILGTKMCQPAGHLLQGDG